jgi:hypothetical protein
MKSTTHDPIAAEVRAARDEHAVKFGYDVAAIFNDIREQQMASGKTFVRYPPRPAKVVAQAKKNGSDL